MNLTGADLRGAANLGAALLAGAELGETDLTGATLARANLRGARLCRARMEKATDGVQPGGLRLERRSRAGSEVHQAGPEDLTGMKLAGAERTKAVFLACVIDDVDARSRPSCRLILAAYRRRCSSGEAQGPRKLQPRGGRSGQAGLVQAGGLLAQVQGHGHGAAERRAHAGFRVVIVGTDDRTSAPSNVVTRFVH